jgi:hypothetical protein
MPRTRRGRGRPPHTWKDDWIICPEPTLDELIREMEKPLHEAIGFAGALKLMGKGLAERGDEGFALLAVSDVVYERLHAMQEIWLSLLQWARGR